MTGRTWQLRLVYDRIPLSLNDRAHWAATAAIKRQLRDTVRYSAMAAGIPRLERIHVQIHWTPKVRRVRDSDNLMLVSKVCIDGLRNYPAMHRNGRMIRPPWTGIVPDDDPTHVTWSPPIIHPADRQLTQRLWIDITDRTGDADE